MQRLRKEIGDIKRQEWLQRLYSCPYRDRKDVNPLRINGTCEWFTNHLLFRDWQQRKTPSVLWVSANPGCGKSVLARYLADEVLPSANGRMTCYFFFKESLEDQRLSTTALCCILHQIFKQRPCSFSDQILRRLERDGNAKEGKDKPTTSFGDLWDILISAATLHTEGEIVCILDGLDECEDFGRNQLIDAISKFYLGATVRTPAIKFLLTSRPYLDIKAGLQDLTRKIPTIRGEKKEEASKISREIDMAIRSRIPGMPILSQKERTVLEEELTRVPNRTHLWGYLISDQINKGLLTRSNIQPGVHNIPRTLDEAYERILSKSQDAYLAKKLLHIVMAAARPLTLQEMALALAIRPNYQSISDLDLVPEDHFRDDIRQLCGLFVVVAGSRIYLLHQTAGEFLATPLLSGSSASPSSTVLRWKFSLHPRESNRILAKICMQRLSLLDFNPSSLRESVDKDQYIATRIFLRYAAQYWPDHFREGNWDAEDWTVERAMSYCQPDLPASAWFGIYQMVATRAVPSNFTPLLVASYFGLSTVVERLPKQAFDDVNISDSRHGRSAVSWAAGEGHSAVLRRLLGTGTRVNAKDRCRRTPLHWAAKNGHDAVVQLLLEAGANANVKDRCHRTPLHWAAKNSHDSVAQRLLEAGANAKTKDRDYGRTPLYLAVENGHDALVQRLLAAGANTKAKGRYSQTPLQRPIENGCDALVRELVKAARRLRLIDCADVDAKDRYGRTQLYWAAENGHDAMVQLLLETGANAKAEDECGWTPLYRAAKNGHDAVVQRLLEAGANAKPKDRGYCRTPLHWAAENGHNVMVQRLLEAGADAKAEDECGWTPVYRAAKNGYDAVVQRLLEAGADAKTKDRDGRTPLHRAIENGHDTVVQRLLEAGADAKAEDEYGRTPLHWAAENGYDAVVRRLVEVGADIDAKDACSWTPLHRATENGHDAMVHRLIESGANINAKDKYGRTPLHWAARKGHDAMSQRLLVVQWLLEAGADVNTKDRCSWTPLHRAAKNGHDAIVQRLLEAGADATVKDEYYGSTPLRWATKNGHDAVVRRLVEAGAYIDAKDRDSSTPRPRGAAASRRPRDSLGCVKEEL